MAEAIRKSIWNRLRAYLVLCYYATKYNLIELFTRHRQFDWQACGKRTGEVAVVTGGTRGIGLEVVRNFMKCDLHVVIGCRDVSAGNRVIKQLRDEGVTNGSAECFALDLMSLEAVKKFAGEVLNKHKEISILVNNAGIMVVPFEETGDGYESHFQVNYLSPFLLTQLLQRALIKGAGLKPNGNQDPKENGQKPKMKRKSRVVNVSSCASFGYSGGIEAGIFTSQGNYCRFEMYMYTKFLEVISSNTLDRMYEEQGVPIHVNSLHPGMVNTDLYDNVSGIEFGRWLLPYVFKNPAQGADTVTYAALSPEIEGKGGLFFANSKATPPNPRSKDIYLQKQLWDKTRTILELENSI